MNSSMTQQLVTFSSDEAGRPRKLVLRNAGLKVISGPDAGLQHTITTTPVTIGTSPASDVLLSDPTVSSRHAEIALRPAGYLLRDLGSRNGVVAGNWRAEQIYLSPGMLIRMGHTVIEVVDLQETTEITLSGSDRFQGMVGTSVAMRRVFSVLESAARSEATVLVEGESGTGKEVLAEALHRSSPRADGPFVVFDCSTVPAQLVESELFGHEKGAFTGATMARAGVIERAHGGTLFLDEIGELPLDLQPKLLRVIETRRFRRVGSNQPRSVDLRIVAATHRNLTHEVAHNRFRQDLFYRLAVVRLRIPPLRERLEDLPLLINHFSSVFGHENSVAERIPGLLPLLMSYHWPGNVRELRNMVERLAVLPLDAALPSAIMVPSAPSPIAPVQYSDARDRALDQFERNYLKDLLQHTGGNVTKAAELAGVSRRYLTRLIAKHQIERKPGEDDEI